MIFKNELFGIHNYLKMRAKMKMSTFHPLENYFKI